MWKISVLFFIYTIAGCADLSVEKDAESFDGYASESECLKDLARYEQWKWLPWEIRSASAVATMNFALDPCAVALSANRQEREAAARLKALTVSPRPALLQNP